MAQLCQRQQELVRAKVRTIIVSFAAPPFARAWLEETNAPFTLLVDHDRQAYRSYGLEASFWRTWSPRTIWYYARNWGRKPVWDSAEQDLNQLGGDFIIDAQRTVRFAYPSLDPVDRPSVDELLAAIDEIPVP